AHRRRHLETAADASAGDRVGRSDLHEPRRVRSLAGVPRAELPGLGAAASGQGADGDAEGRRFLVARLDDDARRRRLPPRPRTRLSRSAAPPVGASAAAGRRVVRTCPVGGPRGVARAPGPGLVRRGRRPRRGRGARRRGLGLRLEWGRRAAPPPEADYDCGIPLKRPKTAPAGSWRTEKRPTLGMSAGSTWM